MTQFAPTRSGQASAAARCVTVAAQCSSPFLGYALRLIADFCGVDLRRIDGHTGAADVRYGNDDSLPGALRIPESAPYSAANIPPVPTAEQRRAALAGEVFPFDLIEALRFWLTDWGHAELPDSAFDSHDRLPAQHSLQHQLGICDVPIVNCYLLLFRDWLEARLGVVARRHLPAGKKCIVVLSHDVDNPIDPRDPTHALWLAGAALRRGRPRRAVGQMREAWRRLRLASDGARPRHWLFAEIMAAEAKYGFSSTFFFAATSSLEGHGLDVNYDVTAPRFRRAIRNILDAGWEVGLHIGYGARESVSRLNAEIRKLETVTGVPVAGSRHHYWHMQRPFWQTLAEHAAAGLTFDSSVAFNDALGYRLGIAYPFRPWHPTKECIISTVQVPAFCMDGALFYDSTRTVDQALEQVHRALEQLKLAEGCAAIDWHEYTSVPGAHAFDRWAEGYQRILRLLAADPEIEVQSFSQALQTCGYTAVPEGGEVASLASVREGRRPCA